MELLVLIFSVAAGLGAGALGAAIAARREEHSDRELHVTERLQELEHQAALDRIRLERLAQDVSTTERAWVARLDEALAHRDERLEAVQAQIRRSARPAADSSRPHQRLQERITNTAGRVETVQTEIHRLEQRMQARLVAFREGTQDVVRRLAQHQVAEAERVTMLVDGQDERDLKLEQGLRQLESQLSGVEQQLQALGSRLAAADAETPTAPAPTPKAKEVQRTEDLTQLFGIGPKMAERLRAHDVPSVSALAKLSDADIERLAKGIRGLRERERKHGWRAKARRLVAHWAGTDGTATPAVTPPLEPVAANTEVESDSNGGPSVAAVEDKDLVPANGEMPPTNTGGPHAGPPAETQGRSWVTPKVPLPTPTR